VAEVVFCAAEVWPAGLFGVDGEVDVAAVVELAVVGVEGVFAVELVVVGVEAVDDLGSMVPAEPRVPV